MADSRTLRNFLDNTNGELSQLARQTLEHDYRVNQTYEALQQSDQQAEYAKFMEQRAPESIKEYVGYTREYDIARIDSGDLTDVLEVKTNHTPKGYKKAVKQLGYAHWINKGDLRTWYVSWDKDNSRIVKPVWKHKDWERTDNKQQLYKPVRSPDKYDIPRQHKTEYS